MRVEPGGAELLRVARAQLLEQLLPHLPAAHHYTARMVANAMAIAARELDTPQHRPIDAARLAREIRAGQHDGSQPIEEGLRELTRARVAVSNPRVLGSAR